MAYALHDKELRCVRTNTEKLVEAVIGILLVLIKWLFPRNFVCLVGALGNISLIIVGKHGTKKGGRDRSTVSTLTLLGTTR